MPRKRVCYESGSVKPGNDVSCGQLLRPVKILRALVDTKYVCRSTQHHPNSPREQERLVPPPSPLPTPRRTERPCHHPRHLAKRFRIISVANETVVPPQVSSYARGQPLHVFRPVLGPPPNAHHRDTTRSARVLFFNADQSLSNLRFEASYRATKTWQLRSRRYNSRRARIGSVFAVATGCSGQGFQGDCRGVTRGACGKPFPDPSPRQGDRFSGSPCHSQSRVQIV